MVDAYRRSLSQDEVNGMIAFYESSAGQAVVRKMPLIQQNMLTLMQERMKVLMPKIVEVQKEVVARVQAAAAAPKKD